MTKREWRLICSNAWAHDHPNDPNFYVMHLDTGWYIDGRHEVNLSHFINHLCEPNCQLVPFNVDGYMRIGIFSLKDIEPGQFLSFDYQFNTANGDKFHCRCGATSGSRHRHSHVMETVAAGLSKKYHKMARDNRLFLWRNVMKGGDFIE